MKKTIALLLAIMMLCTVLVGCGDNKTQNDNNDSPTKGYVLRLGTDAVGGTANTALEAMSAIVNQKTDMKTSTVVTTGAVEIINLINSGELEGKTVAFPQQGSASAEVMKILFDCYGLTGKVNIEYFGWSDAWEALKDGRVDAACGSWSNGIPASGIIELCTTRDLVILPMSEEVGEKLHAANDGIAYQAMTNANDSSIPEGEVRYAARNSGVCVFGANVSEEAVYTFVKTCIDNIDALGNISQDLKVLKDYLTSVCVPSIPFHPGAARALKEAGLWDDTFTVYGE